MLLLRSESEKPWNPPRENKTMLGKKAIEKAIEKGRNKRIRPEGE